MWSRVRFSGVTVSCLGGHGCITLVNLWYYVTIMWILGVSSIYYLTYLRIFFSFVVRRLFRAFTKGS